MSPRPPQSPPFGPRRGIGPGRKARPATRWQRCRIHPGHRRAATVPWDPRPRPTDRGRRLRTLCDSNDATPRGRVRGGLQPPGQWCPPCTPRRSARLASPAADFPQAASAGRAICGWPFPRSGRPWGCPAATGIRRQCRLPSPPRCGTCRSNDPERPISGSLRRSTAARRQLPRRCGTAHRPAGPRAVGGVGIASWVSPGYAPPAG